MENKFILIGAIVLAALVAAGAFLLFQDRGGEDRPPEPLPVEEPADPAIPVEDEAEPPDLAEGERIRVESHGDLADRDVAMPLSFRKALGGYKGRVLEGSGIPVSGMKVCILGVDFHDLIPDGALFFGEESYRFAPKEEEAVTREDGTFLIPGIFPLAFYALVVDPEGSRTLARIVDVQVEPGEVKDLGDIVLAPCGVLAGRVVDEAGTPLSSVRVRAVDLPPVVFLSGIQDYREGGSFIVRDFFDSQVIEPPPVLKRLSRMLPIPETLTRTDGSFRLEGIPFKPATLVLDRQGFSTIQHGPVSPFREGEKNLGDITLKSGWTLQGLVKDTSGRPVPGAEVRAGSVYAIKEFTVLQPPTHSGEDGTFKIPGLSTLSVRVAVRRRAGEAWILEGPVNPAEGVVEVEIPETHDLKVIVRKEDGSAAAGARIRIRLLQGFLGNFALINPPASPGARMTPLDEAEGIFLFEDLTPGKYEILATAPGCAIQHEDAHLGHADLELEVVLGAAHTVRVRVLDIATQNPVEHALVYAYRDVDEAAFRPEMMNRARSDKDGLAVLEKVSLKEGMRLAASHPAYAVSGKQIEDLPEEETVLELVRGGALEGVVYPGRTGPEPPYMLALDYRGQGASAEAETPRLAVTDIEGNFRLANLTPGRWQINVLPRFFDRELGGLIELADMDELHEADAMVASGETTYVELIIGVTEAAGTSAVTGHVLVDGQPVAEAEVNFYARKRSQTRTDSQGRYFLENVPAGEHLLEVANISVAEGRAEITLSRLIQVAQSITIYEDFNILTGSVTGRVVDAFGGVLPGGPFQLRLFMSEEENPYGVSIDFETVEDGTFSCPSVPIGVYSIECADGKIECDAQAVKVRPGVQAGPVELTGRAMVRVKGRVDLTDLEVEGSMGILLLTPRQAAEQQESGRGRYKGVPFSTSTGEFMTDLAPGEYHVSLLSAAYSGKDMIRLTDLVVPKEGLSQVVLRKK